MHHLSGKVVGRLTVVDIAERLGAGRSIRWHCQCECGKAVTVRADYLNSGRTQSCGCLSVDKFVKRSLKHGDARRGEISSEFRTWREAKGRCCNPNHKQYSDYGGRGIKMCDRWLSSYADFIADMGRRPPKLSLDRIDNNGNYEPANCRWATASEQRRNRRDSHV
jgi:hypothetical protein